MADTITVVETGRTHMVVGEMITVLLTGTETKGEFALAESVTPVGGGVPFLHTHPPAETFQVIDGDFEFYGQDENGDKYTISASPGTVVHVPAGTPHGYSNAGETAGRLRLIFEPAGYMELFFEEAGIPVEDVNNPPRPDGPPDMERLMGIFEKYEIVVLEPPAG